MGLTTHLLLLSLTLAVGFCIVAPDMCGSNPVPMTGASDLTDIERFCLQDAADIRREHFYCRGYVGEDNKVVNGTERFPFPTTTRSFWTIFLQFPALSWMDVNRKASVLRIIWEIVRSQSLCATGVNDYMDFCVANVEIYDLAEYSESVMVVLYNLGVTGDTFDQCFDSGLTDSANSERVVRFRSRRAFNLSLTVSLEDMFSQNIGPASSIGDPSRDPTLRPIILGSWPGNLSLSQALDMRGSFGSNPNPINYGLEAGDIVFAFFGSILLVVVAIVVVLGFFVHPFFLS